MNNFQAVQNARIDERYLFAEHTSGLKIFLIPKDTNKSFALFGTRYGAMDHHFFVDDREVCVPDGIAHFLEHKLFENEDGSDTFSRFAALGASCNAFTSNEMTAFLFSATTNYHESLEVLLRFVTAPYFTPKTVQKEQGIIAQEIKMYEDDPDYQLYQGLLQCLYVNHPFKIDVAGTVESISQITDQTLYDCYNTFYNLRNMALVLCGPFEEDKVLAACDKVLKQAPPFSLRHETVEEPNALAAREIERFFPVSMPQFALGLKETETGGDPKTLLNRVAEQEIALNLFFGRSSDFFSSLYQEGLINESFSPYYQFLDTCAFTLFQGESDHPDKVFERCYDTIRRAKAEGFSDEDFERSKKAVYGSMIQSFNAPSEIACQFLSMHFLGADLFTLPDALARVTRDSLTRRIAAWEEDLLAKSIIFPKGEPHAE